MFGQNQAFGGANTFGANMNATAFGAKTPAPAGTFGTPTFGASTPMFGSQPTSTATTGLFGATTPGSTFGQPAATSASTFGFGAANPSAGMFGGGTQQQPATTGLFGAQSTSAFGAAKPAGFTGFGGTNTASTGLFGQNKQTSLFGSNTSTAAGTTLFGTPAATTTAGGLFSSTGFGATPQSGTTVKFNAVTGTDTMMKNGVSTNINTKHQCITTMKEYENKSIDELRTEDYLANRKGPQGGSTFTAQPSTGLFGVTPAPAATGFNFGGAQNKSMFGSTAQTGLFGQQQQQAAQPQTTGLFGQTASTGFGAATTSAGGTAFGGLGATKSLFNPAGTAQPQTTGLFGQAAPQASSSFGSFGAGFGTSTQQSSLFGAKPAAFGAPTTAASAFNFGTNTSSAATGSSLFGQKPASSVFNAAAAPAFGSPFGTTGFQAAPTTQAAGLFGTGTTSAGFNFTSNTPSFGATSFGTGFGAGLGTSTGGTLFGSTAASKPAFNFGSALGAANTFGSTGFGTGLSTNLAQPLPGTTLTGDTQAQHAQAQKQLLALSTTPFGDSPLFRNIVTESGKREELLKPTNPLAQKALLSSNQLKMSPMPKVQPKNWNRSINGKKALFDGLDDEESSSSIDMFVPRRSVKKLVLKPKSSSPNSQPKNDSVLDESIGPDVSMTLNSSSIVTPVTPIVPSIKSSLAETPQLELGDYPLETSPDVMIQKYTSKPSETTAISSSDNAIAFRKVRQKISFNASMNVENSDNESEGPVEPSTPAIAYKTGIRLNRPGYYTIPSPKDLDELEQVDGRYIAEDFTVGREGYGSVYFPGKTDVTELNLDEIVHIRRKEIIIYPDDHNKPEVGCGLNKHAEVTLDGVWPNDKETRALIKSPEKLNIMKYHEKIERSTIKIGAKFLEYRPETGSWLFQVEHFSKYALDESDEEDGQSKQKAQLKASQKPSTNNNTPVDMDFTAVGPFQNLPKSTETPVKSLPTSYLKVDMNLTSVNDTERMLRNQFADNSDDDEMEDITHQTMPLFGTDDETEEAYVAPQSMMAPSSDVRQVQMMKASFFYDEDMDEDFGNKEPRPATTQISTGALFRNKFLVNNRNEYGANMNTTNDESVATPTKGGIANSVKDLSTNYLVPDLISKHPKLPSGLDASMNYSYSNTNNSVPSKTAVTLPYSQSLMARKDNIIADSACFNGQRFRVGWSTDTIMTRVAVPNDLSKSTGQAKYNLLNMLTQKHQDQLENTFCVRKESVNWSNKKASMYEPNLKIALKHSKNSAKITKIKSNDCPVIVPEHGVEALHEYSNVAEVNEATDDSPEAQVSFHVWSLCVSLWGKLPGLGEEDKFESYVNRMVRRKALSAWLTRASKHCIESEIEKENHEPDGYLKELFSHLSGQHVRDAYHRAQKNGDHRLALLLSQGGGSTVTRKMLQRQLEVWESTKADRFIDTIRMKIFCLLAGVMVWQASDQLINTCEGLDWKRSLALHLWYHCSSSDSLRTAFSEYEKSFKGESPHGEYSTPPHPSYVEQDPSDIDSADHFDLCYHLIKLYSDRTHRLNRLLTPATHTSNSLDHSLSWHLSQVLKSLGFSHLSEHDANLLHVNYACQLEQAGSWQWAVFVLLHISNNQRRMKSVTNLLDRYITLEDSEEQETFLIENLAIPLKWIHKAKSLRARHLFKHHDEAYYLSKAGKWNESHRIICQYIAPDAIINEDYNTLEKYLEEFDVSKASTSVLDWQNGGQLYLDYIHVSKTISDICERVSNNQEVDVYELERLQPIITSICSRVSSLPTSNAKETLCQSEMAKKAANLLRIVLSLQNKDSIVPTNQLTPHIRSLPMPEDYSLQELQNLTRSYMLEVSNY